MEQTPSGALSPGQRRHWSWRWPWPRSRGCCCSTSPPRPRPAGGRGPASLLASLPLTVAILLVEPHLDLVYGSADRITVLHSGAHLHTGTVPETRSSPEVAGRPTRGSRHDAHHRRVHAGYGGGTVLHGIDLVVPEGGALAVLGMNGAGKTTLVHTIADLVKPRWAASGWVTSSWPGPPATGSPRAGVALVPQGRRVFASLTVAEHLALPRRKRRLDRAADPGALSRLGERLPTRATSSPAARRRCCDRPGVLTQPRLLLLDEPCEGLAVDLAARVPPSWRS